MNEITVHQIVAEWLKQNGYDGLAYPGECACLTDDLAPCGEIQGGCTAGYRALCAPGCGHEGYDPNDPSCWHIQLKKPEGK